VFRELESLKPFALNDLEPRTRVRAGVSAVVCPITSIRPKKARNYTGATGPWGVCFKPWLLSDKLLQLFSPLTSLARIDFFLNSEPDPRRQFSQSFWSAFFVFKKMRL